jgi:hypothetical protein
MCIGGGGGVGQAHLTVAQEGSLQLRRTCIVHAALLDFQVRKAAPNCNVASRPPPISPAALRVQAPPPVASQEVTTVLLLLAAASPRWSSTWQTSAQRARAQQRCTRWSSA